MVTGQEFADLREKHNDLRFQFANTELDLAITFWKRAISAVEEATADRNAQNATRAYESAIRTLGNLSLDGHPEIAVKLTRLAEILPEVQRPRPTDRVIVHNDGPREAVHVRVLDYCRSDDENTKFNLARNFYTRIASF
jgi:hypothetical protein